MLFLGGCATRLGNNVGGPVIRTFYHTTLDIFRMIGDKFHVLDSVGDSSVYGCCKVIVDVPVCQSIKKCHLLVDSPLRH